MKIGVVGGTFDPIHEGHLRIGKTALEALALDEVWYMPVNHNPFTKHCVASGQQRVDMLRLALKPYDTMNVCDYELKLPSEVINYTFDTMSALKERHPNDTFYYVIGADQVNAFDRWYKAKELSTMVQLVALRRKGYDLDEKNIKKYCMHVLDLEPLKVSSTEIKQGHKLKYVAPDVLSYITAHGLYLDTMIQNYMSSKRYQHSLSVASVAQDIASANGLDAKKAYIAGMLHDIGKEIPEKKARKLMEQYYPEHLDASVPVWHQWLSCYLAKKDFKCDDLEVLQAIEHHTTASTSMSLLDMCIYVADKYEPLRGFDSTEMLERAKEDIQEAFIASLSDFYNFSKKKNRPIDDVFFDIYNKYHPKERKDER